MNEIEREQYQAAAIILAGLVSGRNLDEQQLGMICLRAASMARGLYYQTVNPLPDAIYQPPEEPT